jgi:hypothetical protein
LSISVLWRGVEKDRVERRGERREERREERGERREERRGEERRGEERRGEERRGEERRGGEERGERGASKIDRVMLSPGTSFLFFLFTFRKGREKCERRNK